MRDCHSVPPGPAFAAEGFQGIGECGGGELENVIIFSAEVPCHIVSQGAYVAVEPMDELRAGMSA